AAVTELEGLNGGVAPSVLLGEPVGELPHLLRDVFGVRVHVTLREVCQGLRQVYEGTLNREVGVDHILSALPRLRWAPKLSGRKATATVRKRTASVSSSGFDSSLLKPSPRLSLIQKSAGYCACARRSNCSSCVGASSLSSCPASPVSARA